MLMDSVGQKFRKDTVKDTESVARLCPMMSGTWTGKVQNLGCLSWVEAGIIQRLIHSHVWCLAWEGLED